MTVRIDQVLPRRRHVLIEEQSEAKRRGERHAGMAGHGGKQAAEPEEQDHGESAPDERLGGRVVKPETCEPAHERDVSGRVPRVVLGIRQELIAGEALGVVECRRIGVDVGLVGDLGDAHRHAGVTDGKHAGADEQEDDRLRAPAAPRGPRGRRTRPIPAESDQHDERNAQSKGCQGGGIERAARADGLGAQDQRRAPRHPAAGVEHDPCAAAGEAHGTVVLREAVVREGRGSEHRASRRLNQHGGWRLSVPVQFKRRKAAGDLAAPQIAVGLQRGVRNSDLDEGRDGDRTETRDGRARSRRGGGGEQRRDQPEAAGRHHEDSSASA